MSLSSKINNKKNLSTDFEHGPFVTRCGRGRGASVGVRTSLRFPRQGHPLLPRDSLARPPVPGPQATDTRERSLGGTMAAAARARRAPVLGKGLS